MRAAGKKIYLNTPYVFHNYIENVLKNNKVMGESDPEKERQKK